MEPPQARTRVFVSYSRQDAAWLRRVQQHLAVLERWGLIHMWSDRRLSVGTRWETQIERQLRAAKVAVLLISPAFLASDYIQRKELPRIIEHSRADDGLKIVPLVVRACAWRLDSQLAMLQSVPSGYPLAVNDDARVDLDLADFAYQLAQLIGRTPDNVATGERELIASVRSGARHWDPMVSAAAEQAGEAPPPETAPVLPTGRWSGDYVPRSGRTKQLTITIEKWTGTEFSGWAEYGCTRNTIRGNLLDPETVSPGNGMSRRIEFTEPAYSSPHNYRARITDSTLSGQWFNAAGKVPQADYELRREL